MSQKPARKESIPHRGPLGQRAAFARDSKSFPRMKGEAVPRQGWVREIRTALGLSQSQLAKRAGARVIGTATNETGAAAIGERLAPQGGAGRALNVTDGAAVEALATRPSAAESVVLSTCNRSEIYVASSDPTRAREDTLS